MGERVGRKEKEGYLPVALPELLKLRINAKMIFRLLYGTNQKALREN